MEFPDNNIKYNKGLCPIAESIQSKLIQLKTNYENLEYAKKQASILNQIIRELNS